MLSTFKISALAVLVSISVAGCHSHKDNSPIKEPTVINKQDNIKKPVQPEKKADQTKPTILVEQPNPEAQLTPQITQKGKGVTTNELPEVHFKNGKGVTTNELPEVHFKNGKGVTTNELPGPGEKLPEHEKLLSIDSLGKRWRIVKMNGEDASLSEDTLHFKSDVSMPNQKPNLNVGYNGVLKNTDLINSTTEFDLDKLSNGTLGLYSGSFVNNNLSGYIYKDGAFTNTDRVNYIFINQPYSSYGMLYTNENEVIAFYQGIDPYPITEMGGGALTFEYTYSWAPTVYRAWSGGIPGNATYKGQVIAAIQTHDHINHMPKVDGIITLNAKFGDPENSYVSGELDSNSIGKVTLPKAKIHEEINPPEAQGGIFKELNDKDAKLSGNYQARFFGGDLKDVMGEINLSRDSKNVNNGGVVKYHAVFGATKHPKAE